MKEKAKELVDRFFEHSRDYYSINNSHAKQCALICATMLAEQEDEYNYNDPKRKSKWWEVIKEIKNN